MAIRIWAVTDGRAGNEVPAAALAEGVAQKLDDKLAEAGGASTSEIAVKRIALAPGHRALPAPLWALRGWGEGANVRGWPFSGLASAADLNPPWPDLVISAGRRAAPIAAALRARSQSVGHPLTAVQILDPKMAPRHFDLVITPAHDGLRGPGVLSLPASLGRPPSHAPEPGALAVVDGMPRPLVAVLLGGPSRAARMTAGDLGPLAARVAAHCASGGGAVALGSRRTPSWAVAALRRDLSPAIAAGQARIWTPADAPAIPNPYAAALQAADAFFVTADSVNMTSEAAATGKPVYAAPVSRLATKLQRFHAALEIAGHVRPLASTADDVTAWRPNVALDTLAVAVEAVAALLTRATPRRAP